MGENEAAASGNRAPATPGGDLLAPSRRTTRAVRRADAWLASSLLLSPSDCQADRREGYPSFVRRSARLYAARIRDGKVAREEILVNGQSLRVALYYAKTGGIVRTVRLLDPSLLREPLGVAALLRAIKANRLDVVKELLIGGVDPNNSNTPLNFGGTPVHTAALKGHVRCLRPLVDYGADVNARLSHGTTPLHIAAQLGHTVFLDTLIALGGNVNAVCARGMTPLHVAVLAGFADCVLVLMDKAANSKLRDANGHEPICYAVEKEDITMGTMIVVLQCFHAGANTSLPQDYPTCGHNMAQIYEVCSF